MLTGVIATFNPANAETGKFGKAHWLALLLAREWEPLSDSEGLIHLGTRYRNEAATLFFALRNQ